ncbi:chitin deacetylase 7 [Bactrocera neohumeralis]|uniref:chitin deacetylase 7 n=1 Tax=Bactrocera tryoni TaxID=59916 RepID=UPI001A961C9F|nr:chitin deacetylase 7 [Bactrocera tryoni]XP_050325146.1 chitin deacetylase 7 [Bactrocera neohumeralis]
MLYKTTFAVTLLVVLSAVLVQCEEDVTGNFLPLKKAGHCNIEKCQLPNCRCSGLRLPSADFKGHVKEIPQLITVTFDDAVNVINYEQYQQIFDGLVNPDNCSVRGTFFVSHEYTDYTLVNALYQQGHEIALHSVTHGSGTDYWREADVERLMAEFGQQIDMLVEFAKVNRKHIRGVRLPFLQISGNNTYEAAKRLGLLYDSSWPSQRNPPMWPYTLDYRSTQDCQIGPCPNAAIPGFWVSPMVTWLDTVGYNCAMIDGCIFPPKDEVDTLFEWMVDNFKRHYDGNRAPFGMYLHAAWFQRGRHYFEAFRKFLLYVNTLPDVYLTTASGVIHYMKHPTLGKPFPGCPKKPNTTCIKRNCGLRKMESGETRYMNVCDTCPSVYPWLGNALGQTENY